MATNNAANQSSAGIQSLTSGGVFNGRTITGTSNQISVSNGDGTAGNPTLSLTSTIQVSGISFDSGSNTLSNYATGTFNSTFTGSVSNPTVTYTSQVGRWTRIGNRVIVATTTTVSAYSGGSGNIQVSTLPFTSNNTSNNTSAGSTSWAQVTFSASVLYYATDVDPNTTVILFKGSKSASTVDTLPVGNLSASTSISASITYEV